METLTVFWHENLFKLACRLNQIEYHPNIYRIFLNAPCSTTAVPALKVLGLRNTSRHLRKTQLPFQGMRWVQVSSCSSFPTKGFYLGKHPVESHTPWNCSAARLFVASRLKAPVFGRVAIKAASQVAKSDQESNAARPPSRHAWNFFRRCQGPSKVPILDLYLTFQNGPTWSNYVV